MRPTASASLASSHRATTSARRAYEPPSPYRAHPHFSNALPTLSRWTATNQRARQAVADHAPTVWLSLPPRTSSILPYPTAFAILAHHLTACPQRAHHFSNHDCATRPRYSVRASFLAQRLARHAPQANRPASAPSIAAPPNLVRAKSLRHFASADATANRPSLRRRYVACRRAANHARPVQPSRRQ